jgi:hypothetical protein
MANVTFAYPNRTDEGTLSGGAWQAGLPLANLQDRTLSKVARSTDTALASTKFDLDLTQARWIGALALVGHNVSVLGKVRITAADSQANLSAAPIYSSGWIDCWPAGVIPQSLLEWEDDNFWLGTLSAEARAAWQAPFIQTFGRQIARWWRVEIDDTTNADAYVHIGRLFLADVWTPTMNMSYGNGLALEDKSNVEEALGGNEYFYAKRKARLTRLSLDWLGADEIYARLLDMQRLLGITGELLLVPDADDTANQQRRAYLGRMARLAPLDHASLNVYRTQLEIRELL